jgi:hypothetical protein
MTAAAATAIVRIQLRIDPVSLMPRGRHMRCRVSGKNSDLLERLFPNGAFLRQVASAGEKRA